MCEKVTVSVRVGKGGGDGKVWGLDGCGNNK